MKLPDFALNRANRILREAPTELPSVVDKAAKKLRKLSRRDLERLPLLVELLKYTVAGHYKPSAENLAIVLGGVIYFLMPLDLVPDFIPVAGFLDDVSVIAWCCVAAKEELDRFSAWLARVTEEIGLVSAVQAALGRLLARTNAYVGHGRNQPPSAGSIYEIEQQASPKEESLDTGLSLTWFLLEALGEHASLFLKALQPQVEVIAPATCVRVMLETSARIQWILDRELNARERVGRVYALRYQELEQDLKFLSARGGRSALEDRQNIRARMRKITADASRDGYLTLRSEKGSGKQIGIHISVPKTTDLIREAIDQEIPYRLLSGLVHTRVLSLRRWCYETLPDPHGPGGSAVKTLPTDKIALLGALAASCIKNSVETIARYLGWDLVQLREITNEAATSLNVVMEAVVGPLPESEIPTHSVPE